MSVTSASRLKENVRKFHLLGFASSALKRVCRATLQAEVEECGLQNAVEHGDRLRRVLCELLGKLGLGNVNEWHCGMRRPRV